LASKKTGHEARTARRAERSNPLQGLYDLFDARLGKLEPKWLPLSLVYLAMSLITNYANYKATGMPTEEWHENLWNLAPSAGAPNVYRMFSVVAAEAVHVALHISPTAAYMLNGTLFVFLAMCVFHVFLKKWFSSELSFAAVLFTFAALPLTYGHITQPWDQFTLLTFALGFLAIRDRKDAWLVPIILVGTFNRETTIFLVLAYFLCRFDEDPKGRLLAYCVVYGLCWAGPYLGIREYIGPRDYYTDYWMVEKNVTEWYYSIAFPALLFGIFWILALMDIRKKPKFLVRSAMIIPPFFILHFFMANMMEVRLFTTLFFLMVPLALFSLFKEKYLKADRPDTGKARAGAEEE